MKKRVLFIASAGGHLNELMQLEPMFKDYDYYLVTEKIKANLSLLKKFENKVSFLVFGSKHHFFSYLFKFPYNCIKSFFIFLKIKPEVIITTGSHTGVPMCYIAKLFRKRVIFIETFANQTSKTLSGSFVYPIADLFIVQWESMLDLYPEAKCIGWIY